MEALKSEVSPRAGRFAGVRPAYRRQGADGRRIAHARLLPWFERFLQWFERFLQGQEISRNRLFASCPLADRPPRRANQPHRQRPRIHEIVSALFDKHIATVEQIGGISSEEFARLNLSLVRLERFWTDQIRYRL
jgi:hypothetical protein